MKLYKLCFVFAGKLIFWLYRQSTKELKYMKAKIKYNNNTFVTRHARRYLSAALLAPAVTVGETEGAMDSTSVYFGLFFCL